jgi:hypothetical protein
MTRLTYSSLTALVLGFAYLLSPARTLGQLSATDQKPPSTSSDEAWKKQFQAGTKPLGSAANSPAAQSGHVTYTLHFPEKPTPEEDKILKDITHSVDEAAKIYNKNTKLKKALDIYYSPGTPTADGNINGSIRIGKVQHNVRVVLHEMGHTMGVGTHQNWGKLMVDHLWKGERANKLLQEYTHDPKAQLHGDHMHFWPYGLNYDNEVKSDEDLIRHAKLVEAIVEDLNHTK